MPTRERTMLDTGVILGDWWHQTDDRRFQCDLCPRLCKLHPGQRGFCFVREARTDGIALTSYGRASGFCIDPIEKKPLNHFFPGSSVLSFGTAGCNLGCRFCQNWDISKAREMDRLMDYAGPKEVAQAAQEAGCKSIAFTYNDPVIFAEYAIDCAIEARALDLKTVGVTAGYITPEAREPFFSQLDAANVDLKSFTEHFYHKLCFAHLDPVLETLIWLKNETEVWLEITNLLIPGQNDTEEEIKRLCNWILEHLGPEVPIHFTAFHPDFKMLKIPATPYATIVGARKIALESGLRYVYTGNINDVAGQSTYCASCDALVVERNAYSLGEWKLDENGSCQHCGSDLPGRFDKGPGNWGPRRQRIVVGK